MQTQSSQPLSALQQKQGYLRDHIQADKYQDFYEYCQKVIGSVDINSWTIGNVQEIVNKFKIYMKDQQNKNVAEYPLQTYNQYQSKSNAELANIIRVNTQTGFEKNTQNTQRDETSEVEEYKSSRIIKPSAVDLLNEVLEKQNDKQLKTQQKINLVQPPPLTISSNITFSQQFSGNSNFDNKAQNKKNSDVSFNEFQLWTSTISNKNEDQTKQQSTKQQQKKLNQSFHNSPPPQLNQSFHNSPPQHKKSEKKSVQYYYNLQYPQQNKQQIRQNPIPRQPQQRQFHDDDFNIFTSEVKKGENKKTSPYFKKQPPKPYKTEKSSIRIKQIKQYHETSQNERPSTKQRGRSASNRNQNEQNYQQNFQQQITCYKSTIRNKLADRNLNVIIDKHQIIQRKFLAPDYAMYNVKIIPLEIECKRNYEDFEKLKKTLAKFFPGFCLPFLEQKSWLSNKINIDFINNQKKMLQFFIKDLIRNKQIRNSRVMEDFLTIKEHKAIKRKFQSYQKMEPLKSLNQMCLLEGKVHVTLNSSQKIYIEHFEKFVHKLGQLYNKQQRLTQSLISQYNQLTNTYKSLMASTEQIENQIKDFNSKISTNPIKHLGQAMKILKETYMEQFSNAKFQHQINSKKILPFIKYEKRNFLQLNHLINLQKKMKKSYDRRSLTQKIGIGENYLSQSSKNHKKSFLEENSSLLIHKYQVAYLGQRIRNEGQRVFDELGVKIFKRFQTLGQSYLNKISSSISYWQNFMKMDKQKFRTDLTY